METSSSTNQVADRRTKPRINCSYPAIIQGLDENGQKFRTKATLTNMSAIGLCIESNSECQPGKEMFVLFRCSSTGPLGASKAPLIAVNGDVVRIDKTGRGVYTIGVKINHNRFL